MRKSFKRNPDSFREALLDKPAGTLVIVDEIQKVPELLDSVHWLMVNKGLWFVLSGSSSRKLKRSGANTLGGRAIPRTLFPLVWKEVPDFQIDKAVQNGMIPRHYLVDDATDRLEAYVEVYLREEIRDEAAVQDVEAFEQFMEAAAISDGEIINYSNIASDCGVAAKTVKTYYQILKDTLVNSDDLIEDYKLLRAATRLRGVNVPPNMTAYISITSHMLMFGTAVNRLMHKIEDTAVLIPFDEIYHDKKSRHIGAYLRFSLSKRRKNEVPNTPEMEDQLIAEWLTKRNRKVRRLLKKVGRKM